MLNTWGQGQAPLDIWNLVLLEAALAADWITTGTFRDPGKLPGSIIDLNSKFIGKSAKSLKFIEDAGIVTGCSRGYIIIFLDYSVHK